MLGCRAETFIPGRLTDGYGLSTETAERLIVEDAPWVFFWHRSDYMLRQAWMAAFDPHPVYSMDKGLDVSFTHPPGR